MKRGEKKQGEVGGGGNEKGREWLGNPMEKGVGHYGQEVEVLVLVLGEEVTKKSLSLAGDMGTALFSRCGH